MAGLIEVVGQSRMKARRKKAHKVARCAAFAAAAAAVAFGARPALGEERESPCHEKGAHFSSLSQFGERRQQTC